MSFIAATFLLFNVVACTKTAVADDRTKFYGTYKITGSCTGNNTVGGTVTVIESSTAKEVLMSYSPTGASIKATISGDVIVINSGQTYITGGLVVTFTGSGRSNSGSSVILNSTYTSPGYSTISCTETWVKQ